jgi:integrase
LRKLQGPGWKAGTPTKWFYAAHSGSRSGAAYVVPTDPGAESGLIFPSADGTPLLTTNLAGWFGRVCKRAGVAKTYHGMRHDCGSFMLADLVPLTVVSKHLRHANTNITAEIYAHLIADQARLGAESMERYWASIEALAEAV